MKSNAIKKTKNKQARSNYKWANRLACEIEKNRKAIDVIFRTLLALEMERCEKCDIEIYDMRPPLVITGTPCDEHKEVEKNILDEKSLYRRFVLV